MPRQDGDALDDNSDDSDSYSNFGAEPGFVPSQQQQPQFPPRESHPYPR